MDIRFKIAVALFVGLMSFGLHGAACNMHLAAVAMFRTHHHGSDKYSWSYAYCKIVGAPARALLD